MRTFATRNKRTGCYLHKDTWLFDTKNPEFAEISRCKDIPAELSAMSGIELLTDEDITVDDMEMVPITRKMAIPHSDIRVTKVKGDAITVEHEGETTGRLIRVEKTTRQLCVRIKQKTYLLNSMWVGVTIPAQGEYEKGMEVWHTQ